MSTEFSVPDNVDNTHIRFLTTENTQQESDEYIKFADEGHRYWAFSPYFKEWVTNDSGAGSAPVVSTTTILGNYWAPIDFKKMAINIWNKPENRIKMATDTTYKYFGCKSVDDILAKWSTGSTLGTKMHNHFEDMGNILEWARKHGDVDGSLMALYKNRKVDDGYQEVRYFFEACDQLGITSGKRKFWRTEFLMWHDVLHISGMADGILYDEEQDHYIIIDWKRVGGGLKGDPENGKPIHMLAESSRGRILPSFQALRKHDTNKYGCQLTLYKHMFEHMFPDKKIGGIFLVVVDSKKVGRDDALKIHEVPLNKYDQCITEVFQHRAKDIMDVHSNSIPMTLARKLLTFFPALDDTQVNPAEIPSVFSETTDEDQECPNQKRSRDSDLSTDEQPSPKSPKT